MKPKEFDDLVRQKFDQNDFEYSPQNWGRLEEQLDGRAKKRSIMMWWWMPLAGVAASVALAIGITSMWQPATTTGAGISKSRPAAIHRSNLAQNNLVQNDAVPYPSDALIPVKKAIIHKKKPVPQAIAVEKTEYKFGINLANAVVFNAAQNDKKVTLPVSQQVKINKDKEKGKEIVLHEVNATFKPDVTPKAAPKLSIILLGGINRGAQNNGYVAGATIRRKLSDKVYIESDVAFASSNNTTTINEMIPTYAYAKSTAASKTSGTLDASRIESKKTLTYVAKSVTDNFNLSYAQVSPSIGVQIMKKMSVAAGPDFQQALADTRPPAVPIENRPFDNVSVMPLFDMGLIGKAEYSLTKKVKAQVSYRKGINNILTPMDKYIDRDYLQVQVRYSIFNR